MIFNDHKGVLITTKISSLRLLQGDVLVKIMFCLHQLIGDFTLFAIPIVIKSYLFPLKIQQIMKITQKSVFFMRAAPNNST